MSADVQNFTPRTLRGPVGGRGDGLREVSLVRLAPGRRKAIVAGFDVFDQPIEAKRRTGYLPGNAAALPRHERLRVSRLRREDQRACRRPTGAQRVQYGDGAHAHRRHGEPALRRSCRKATSSASASRQALIHNPDVLILDEPTAGLDPKQIIETRELIKELAGDHTIILSTHILPEVSQTCQRVVIINKGQRRRRRHARQPDGAAARLGNDVRAGGRQRRRRRRRARPRAGVTRVVEADRRDGVVGYEVDSESGRDVRRELARAVVGERLGPARAAADAHEPRGDLPVADDRRSRRRRRGRRAGRRSRPMRNILAIAQKELKSYFASPIAYIVIGCWRCSTATSSSPSCTTSSRAEHADEPVRHAGAAVDEHQPAADPAAAAERHDPDPVPACRWSRCAPTRRRSDRARSSCC